MKRLNQTSFEKSRNQKFSRTQPSFILSDLPHFRITQIREDKFGAHSPSWTIGSSRKPPKDEDPTPGPSDYSPVDSKLAMTTGHRICAAYDHDYRTLTSNIETPNLRGNDRYKLKPTIGTRKDTFFFYPTDSPGKIYTSQRSTLSPHGYRIATRYKDPENKVPGPGAYSPRDEQPVRLATIDRSRSREIFVPAEPDVPGPGAYDIEQSPRRKNWYSDKRITKKKRIEDDFSD